MLLVSMCFWEFSTNTFQLLCGMVTPTLFDIVGITDLWSSGEDYECSADSNFKILNHDYNTFIGEHQDSNDIVDACEHITFLTYWLFRYVFFPRMIQITKMYISLDTRLHETVNVFLNRLILASLYEALGHALENLRRGVKSFKIMGPIWLLQLWLNSTFSYALYIQIPPSTKVGAKVT